MAAKQELLAKAADILVVDDTIDGRNSLTEILTNAGYKPHLVEEPQLALEAAFLHPPDLVLLDIKMPEMSGFELCRQLKQNERTREVPVIVVSGLDEVQGQIECFKAGGVDFISKPAQETELLLRVNTLLQLRETQLRLDAHVAERTVELERLLHERSEALLFAEEQIRSLFESSPLGVALTNIEGRFLAVNKALADMLRSTEAELLRRKVYDVYVDPDQRVAMLKRLRKTGTLRDRNLHLLRDDGSSFYARLNSSHIDLAGRYVILAFVDDVTDQIVAEQEAAVFEERERLARDLHDDVIQTLFSASVLAHTLPSLMDKNPAFARQSMERLEKLIHGGLAEMRALLLELRPGEFRDKNRAQLFELLAESTRARTQAKVSLNVDKSYSLPEDVTTSLYRIAQESLNNVAKHALASEIFIELTCDSKGAKLTIKDDGRGYDTSVIPAGHFGLSIMHERALDIGANIKIESEIDGGTLVYVTWSAAGNESASGDESEHA
jgi:PAS domain S-box-containing protein